MVAELVYDDRRPLALFPRQRRFVLDPARFPAAIGGIGSGKSFVAMAKIIPRLDRKEIGMVTAPTYPMLRDATQRTLLRLLDDLGVAYIRHKTDNSIIIAHSGHEIIFRSADDPDKLRGPNLCYAVCDEISLHDKLAWQIIKGRVREGIHPQAWVAGTPKGRNFVWEEWERDANPDHPLYRFRTDENPTLPEGFADSLGYTGRFAEQELGGQFVAFEGVVYPMFNRERHVRHIDCDGWSGTIGVDAGVRNPSAIITIRHSGDARHQEREVYRRGMSSRELIAAVEAEADLLGDLLSSIEVDPSAAGLIADLAADGYPVRKADNNVTDGIREVTTALEDGMTVDPSCVNTIAEYESYAYPDGARTEQDKPVKQSDHAMDADRYALMGLAAPVAEVRIW